MKSESKQASNREISLKISEESSHSSSIKILDAPSPSQFETGGLAQIKNDPESKI